MSKDVKALIRGGRLPERTVPVCLQADLVAEHELAERQLAEATRRASDSLAGGSGMREIAERIEALRVEMQDHTIDFRLRAMPRPRWKAFIAAHPPRKDDAGKVDERDRAIGVNTETFFDALVRASVVEPELDASDWDLLLDERLTDRQFDELADAAWGLNRRDVDVPFSPAASRVLRGSEPE
ncbi:hypothetical protein ACFHW1_04925 [Micromonospora sp. LOL_014]|uniref:hypothetical protein n=1 Tax=Micromonospora sp. LOL_014 TaxID=3345415 RepID=UPI003A8A3D1B